MFAAWILLAGGGTVIAPEFERRQALWHPVERPQAEKVKSHCGARNFACSASAPGFAGVLQRERVRLLRNVSGNVIEAVIDAV